MVEITLKKQSGRKCLESLNWYENTEIIVNSAMSIKTELINLCAKSEVSDRSIALVHACMCCRSICSLCQFLPT